MSRIKTSFIIKRMVRNKDEEDQATKPKRLDFRATWKEIARKQHGVMVAMIILLVMSAVLLIFALVTLHPQGTVVIVGYGDVYGEIAGLSGGYRRDSWLNMLAFPLLAVIFGVVHNLLALRVYRKYGKTPALMLIGATMLLVVGTFIVMLRLLGEW